ncbi:MAG: hypothetical protein NZ602_14730 [Thermoguttaceae bacterium]|nr:hypothetical protein [Thermoguttaceae bacterium]MDW8039033.1 hypothetical protein [Thermoguttaceae bacterium]
MAKSARVLAIEDVDTLAAALVRFAEEAQAALADLDLELRRASQWIEQDRPRYWESQVRLGWEAVARARRELEQARLIHRVDEVPSSCIDQKKALQRAQRRLDLAMQKQRLVRQWIYRTAKQAEEYRGKVSPLVEWLGAEYPRALAGLRRMARALESYISQQAIPTPKSLLEAVEGLASASRGAAEEAPLTPSPAGPTQTDSETLAEQPQRAAGEAETAEMEPLPFASAKMEEPPTPDKPVENPTLPEGRE